jgi:hypothetical protein
MIRFLTLFIGLVTGPQAVEFTVAPPVVRAEVRLEGSTVATIDGPPWTTTVDLGSTLRTSTLEVVGFDAEGAEVSRDRQFLNAPRPRAEAVLAPRTNAEGTVVGARLTWSSPEFTEPRRVELTLDGRRWPYDGEIIDLTTADPESLHLLEARLVFSDEIEVREQLVFGKGHAGRSSYELTAVPVLVAGAGTPIWIQRPWRDGWSGLTVRMEGVDVETGPARLVVVRDPGADPYLARLREQPEARELGDRLPEDLEVRVIGTVPQQAGGGARLFPFSEAFTVGEQGFLRDLETARFGVLDFGLHRVADAVAVAGMRAADGHGRRAVLLLIGDVSDDASRYQPSEVRRFLAELGVPLIVVDLAGGEAGEAWRPTETVTDPGAVARRCPLARRRPRGPAPGVGRPVATSSRTSNSGRRRGASNSSAEAGSGNRGAQLRIGPCARDR